MSVFTEKAIIETFIDLLNRKPLDKITVKDLVDECGVNRSTFYYYFEDIYDLLNRVFEIETQKALENNIPYERWLDGFDEAISFALKNKRAIYHIYNSVSREQLDTYLSSVVGDLLRKAVEHQAEGLSVSEEDKQLVVDLYRFALVGMINEWLEGGMKSNAAGKIERLQTLIEGNMRRMLTRAAER